MERRHILLRGLVLFTPATLLVFMVALLLFPPPLKISFISGAVLKEAMEDSGLDNGKGRSGEGCGGTLGLGAEGSD